MSSVANQICQRQRDPSGLETATTCMVRPQLEDFFVSIAASEQGECPICTSRTCAGMAPIDRHDDNAPASG